VVEATTIDAIISCQGLAPDLIKIDVEGAELRVLRGMSELLRSNRPLAIVVEYWPPGTILAGPESAELPALLEEHGFRARTLSVYLQGRKNVAWVRS
jgi:hypothetical protein